MCFLTKKLSKLKCYGLECVEKNIKWNKADLNKFSGKNYCPKHYKEKIHEENERKASYRKIAKALGIGYPTPLMMRQIKEYHDNGYEYSLIADAVEYGLTMNDYGSFNKFGIAFFRTYIDEVRELNSQRPVERKPIVKRTVKFVPGKGPKKPGLFGKEWDIEKELGDLEDDGADFYKGE